MLTDKKLKALKPTGTKFRIFDKAGHDGFGVQVSAKGAISFFVYYRWDGKQRFMSLGRYPDTKLAKARQRARDARDLLSAGVDPQAHRKEQMEAERQAERTAAALGTVDALFDEYVADLERKGKRAASQVRSIFKRHISKEIGKMKARDVTPYEVRKVLFPIIQRGALVMANRVRSYLMAAFRFGIKWENDPHNFDVRTTFGIQSNPVRDIPKPLEKEAAGDRELSGAEIHRCWPLWGEEAFISPAAGSALRLILATGGQRVEEVLHASWGELRLEDGIWELPASRTKSERPHVVPLTPMAIDIFQKLRASAGDSDFVFPLRGDPSRPMQANSLGNAVRKFCTRVDADRKAQSTRTSKAGRAGREVASIAKFTARDLRRTVKTQMGKMGIPRDIRDRLQNHVFTDVGSKHYDRHTYLPEKREVMAAWGDYLAAIIEGRPVQTNVVPFKREMA